VQQERLGNPLQEILFYISWCPLELRCKEYYLIGGCSEILSNLTQANVKIKWCIVGIYFLFILINHDASIMIKKYIVYTSK
jgi:hypothetical protein